jgi:amino acid adenylation domain-containing protein
MKMREHRDKLYLAAGDKVKERDYWHQKLEGERQINSFPTNRASLRENEYQPGKEEFRLPAELNKALIKLSGGSDVRLHIILTTALTLLLSKHTGSSDITLGTPIWKPKKGMQFINTVLPLRTQWEKCDKEITFKELLLKVRQTVTEANEHRNYPLELMGYRQDSSENPSGEKLFDVALQVENIQDITHLNQVKTGVIFTFKRIGAVIEGQVEYDALRYEPLTIQRIIGHKRQLLEHVLEHRLEIPLSDVKIITDDEIRQIEETFNNRDEPFPLNKSLHGMFEERVTKAPDTVALVGFGNVRRKDGKIVRDHQTLTYRELNRRADRMANRLIQCGARKSGIVAIQVERTVEMIVGMLGILKTGAAYLPINPKNPEKRTRYILKDSNVAQLITDDPEKAEKLGVRDVIDVKEIIGENESVDAPETQLHQECGKQAYIIYTSGSTGEPKGVLVTHANVSPLIHWGFKHLQIGEADRAIQLPSYNFDFSVWEIFLTLASGAALYMITDEILMTAAAQLDFIDKHGITFMNMTPAQCKFLMDEGRKLTSLKHLCLGGETLVQELVKRILRQVGETCRIYNVYGPTETTIIASVEEILRERSGKYDELSNVSIGGVVANAKMKIVGSEGNRTPVYAAGELYIAGDGVAPGYLNNPELTANKFIHTTINQQDLPAYKTGDRVRWLADGTMEFIERIDHQVKIRGYRIELGEIETRLARHEDVKDVRVMVRQYRGGEKYICAYFVPTGAGEKETQPDCDTRLKQYLAGEMPQYMVPEHIIPVEKMPLNTSGKVDMKALPDPGEGRGTAPYQAPRDEVELNLARIWKEILKLPGTPGINDNYFQQGGHSLNATQLIGKIHEQFRVNIPLVDIFAAASLQEMAGIIKTTAQEENEPIEAAEEKEYYPQTSMQSRLYMLQQIGTKQIVYNMPQVTRLEGKLDNDRLETAFQELVDRHESLRTGFLTINDRLVQKIHHQVDLNVECVDNTVGQHREIEQLIETFVRPFDLSEPPLLRVGLIKEDEQFHYLMVDMHHIITDGISMATLFREFMELYDGKSLPIMKLQYKDYAQWTQTPEAGRQREKQRIYWKKQFQGDIPVLELPLDKPRPRVQGFAGKSRTFAIDASETEKLNEQAHNEGISQFMHLLGIYIIFLSRLTGQEDIVVGTPVSGRRRLELQPVIGMFVNTLPLRNQPSGNRTVGEFFKELKDNTLTAFDNQEYPFEELVEDVAVNRDTGRNPLFDVMFMLQNMDVPEVNLPGLKMTPLSFDNRVSKFDMSLGAREMDGQLHLTVEYNTEIFNDDTIERYIRYYRQVVGEVIDNIGKPLSQLQIITEEEKKKICEEFNRTETGLPPEKTLVDMFCRQVEKAPEAVSLVEDSAYNRYITNRQLDENVDRLAVGLRARGVKNGSIVALKLHRSLEVLIGIYGILKTGAAYLPVDPEYPRERVDYILKDSRTELLLTENEIKEILNSTPDSPARNTGTTNAPTAAAAPTDKSYIIYTSGSTGKPKGVVIEHKSVVNILWALQRDYDIAAGDTILMKTSYIFDVSVSEIFGWLPGGARLAILRQGKEKEPAEILKIIERLGVTHINFVPSMFQAFIETLNEGNRDKLANLKTINLAGEVLKPEQVRNFNRQHTGVPLANIYGPTEATIYAAQFPVAQWTGSGSIPIGKPMQNLRICILNRYLKPQPVGVPGELIITGEGLARGYLNQPELTAEKFIPSPIASRGDKTLPAYRTGDLARWLPDGNIEFLGRIDHQVKIRGFRIELEEIEKALLAIEGIKDTVVITREDRNGDHYICAYIVGTGTREELPAPQELTEYVSKTLAQYMIPQYFVPMDEMPLTPGGKIDRKQLPEPRFASKEEHVAPRDKTEQGLVDIWKDVLGYNGEIGIDDNFFQLGGHSLKATIMTNRVHKAFNIQMTLDRVFEFPTVRGQAAYIKQSAENAENEEFSEAFRIITPAEKKDYYALSSAQRRLYFLQQMGVQATGYNMPTFMRLEGELEKNKLETVLQVLIQRHDSFRTRFTIKNGEPVQEIVDNIDFSIQQYEIKGKEPQRQNKIIEEFVRPFNLSEAPLLRVGLIRTGPGQYILMVDMHHIITDGTSIGILVDEIMTLYGDNQLPPLALQYKDYSEWNAGDRQQERHQRKKEYWMNEYRGEIPVLTLPTDNPRPPVQNFEGAAIEFHLDTEKMKALKEFAGKEGVTLFMVLLGVMNILLSKLSGQEDIVIGTPVAGRQHADLQKVVGVFLNTLALRNRPQASKTVYQFIEEIKNGTLAAFGNQEFQYEDLVEQLSLPRDVGRNPLVDVLLVVQNFQISEMKIPGLTLKPYNYRNQTTKFDLTLYAMEGDDRLALTMAYSKALFREDTVKRYVQYYKRILDAVIQDPWQEIGEIQMQPESEKRRLLEEFNDTQPQTSYPRETTIPRMFEKRMQRAPDAVALIARTEGLITPEDNAEDRYPHQVNEIHLTAKELDRRAGILAEWLREIGVLPGHIVAIQMDRSVEMIIGILAILKTGAAYMPISPQNPEKRTQYMLKDSNAIHCLTAKNVIDLQACEARPQETVESHNAPAPEDLAYIIYTSGTTGVPRGVGVEHRNVANLVGGLNERIYQEEEIRTDNRQQLKVAQIAPFIFDASVKQVFAALLLGHVLHVVPEEHRFDGYELNRYYRRHGIDISDGTPTHLQLILTGIKQNTESDGKEPKMPVSYFLIGGEAITRPKAYEFIEAFEGDGPKIVNVYGPTECTVDSTLYIITSSENNGAGNANNPVPIGRPMPRQQIYILDRNNKIQPIGVPGELCIGGDSVGRGYINNPRLTAEKFITNPYNQGQRLYRTGDLARWKTDGNIEYIGRIDQQVKIRGYRIELEEIECRLREYDKIDDAVVIAKEKENTGHMTLAAYIVSRHQTDQVALRQYLAERLPVYMIPSQFLEIKKIPLTPNGKIDRPALEKLGKRMEQGGTYIAPQNKLEKEIAGIWKEILQLEQVGQHDNYFELGGTSFDIIKINEKLKQKYRLEIPVVEMFRYTTVNTLAQYIDARINNKSDNSQHKKQARKKTNERKKVSSQSREIAVIGMAGRFPGAENLHQYWENLAKGRITLRQATDDELKDAGVDPELMNKPNYVRTTGVLKGIENFDAAFFGYTPREAELMDPQVRMFHEVVWTALEDAAYEPGKYDEPIGLYGGATPHFEWEALAMLTGKSLEYGLVAAKHVTSKEYLCSRVSYKLNLSGPSFLVNTACSTSLVAIHLASQALQNGDCGIAAAGGTDASIMTANGYIYQEGMINSPDGQCRAFDASAEGTVEGDGVGVVILKRLDDALRDRDHIYAVIKGSAINNDGIRKAGYTAPSIEGQAEVIRRAQQEAGVEPESISYIEAHGTATKLGDPVEIEALKQAFNTDKKGFVPIGAVKANIGHLDAAAGAAGFIKTVLALKKRMIPPSPNFKTPNPVIDFDNSPFYVNTTMKKWENEQYPLRAGVSAFGVGGTNAHVVLEEAPQLETGETFSEQEKHSEKNRLFILSAATKDALRRMTQNLAGYFETINESSGGILADAAYTLQVGRKEFKHRKMAVCETVEDAIREFSAENAEKRIAEVKEGHRPVIFMFAGLGSQYVQMGRELYQKETLFRQEMDRCFEILSAHMEQSIKALLYPGEKDDDKNDSDGEKREPGNALMDPEIAQLTVFIIEYALARQLLHWGIKPDAMIGYSFGEYAAAAVSGVLTLEDALALIVARGRAVRRLPAGAMLSVPKPAEDIAPQLDAGQYMAIDNGPSTIVAGTEEAVSELEKKMKSQRIMCMRVQQNRAIHTPAMEKAAEDVESFVAKMKLNKSAIPYISNVTGTWIGEEEAQEPRYWANHLKQTVRFADGIKELVKIEGAIFIEVGPGRDLSTLMQRYIKTEANQQVMNLLRPGQKKESDHKYLLNRLGRLWLHGVTVDWEALYTGETRHRLSMPTYSFEKQRYWIEGNPYQMGMAMMAGKTTAAQINDMADWFYIPSWKRQKRITKDIPVIKSLKDDNNTRERHWLIFVDDTKHALGNTLADVLRQADQTVSTVTIGQEYKKQDNRIYTLNPGKDEDYDKLFADREQQEMDATDIIHLWGISGDTEKEDWDSRIDEAQDRGYYSMLNIARALGQKGNNLPVRLMAVTDCMQEVIGQDCRYPEKATVLGALSVVPVEYNNIKCKCVDIRLTSSPLEMAERLVPALVAEQLQENREPVVAYRRGFRWIQEYEPVRIEEPEEPARQVRPGGNYLITGGIGGIGLALAEYLAKEVAGIGDKPATLILVGRSPLPPREQWRQIVQKEQQSRNSKESERAEKIRKLIRLEKIGARVQYYSADVSDIHRMKQVAAEVEDRFGPLNGIIHSAGVADGELIQRRTRETGQTIFRSKLKGTIVLDTIYKETELDFFVLCSSLSAIQATVGQAGYSAANAFLDAYANYEASIGNTRKISVDWDRWLKTGISVIAEERHKELTGEEVIDGMTINQGIDVFARILAEPVPQVAVSTRDLKRLIELSREFKVTQFMQGVEENDEFAPLQQRPELDTHYEPPQTATEKKLAKIWRQFFGFQQIGINDDFFDLGGDSLKALVVIPKTHRVLQVEIPLGEFFNRPTIKQQAEYIDGAVKQEYISIEPVEDREYYPMSSAQERLYILQQVDQQSTGYNSPIFVELNETVKPETIETAVKKMFQRHQSFRTSFEMIDTTLVQRIHESLEPKLEYYKATLVEVEEIVRNFVRPFDMAVAPQIRIGLITVEEQKHILMVDIHHIISDGYSRSIFERDFMALLKGYDLPPLKLQYRDYSQWQKSEAGIRSLKRQEEYWRNVFEGSVPELELPLDFERPDIASFEGNNVHFIIDEEKTVRLRLFMKDTETTLYMMQLALFTVLLSKYTAQEDIVVGSPTTGRRHMDLQDIVGMFVNMLCMRNRPEADKTFKQFLQEVKQNALNAYENQDYQFEELVRTLGLHGITNRNPLFNVVLAMQNLEYDKDNSENDPIPLNDENNAGENIEVSSYGYEFNISRFDLRVFVTELPDTIAVGFQYRTQLFKENTVRQMSEHYVEILDAVLEDSERKLKEIDISHKLLFGTSTIKEEDEVGFNF